MRPVSVLIANRGEIACRLTQACHELGFEACVVYTGPDRLARHVQLADRAVEVSSYLDVSAMVAAAISVSARVVHPGYGFLSENPALAEACLAAGLLFAGPSPAVLRLMGDKVAAKKLAQRSGLPLLPGSAGSEGEAGLSLGFPLLIKAAAGGGGKGMRIVRSEGELETALESARREAASAFGDDRVFLERYVDGGRHVEVQVFGDQRGAVVALGERDCSIQRRYQKVLEESPAPDLADNVRARLHAFAVALAEAAGYVGPGTVEFLVENEQCYFLEMNARLQVEHPVTELVTGCDLAKAQLRVALGQSLREALPRSRRAGGHAIEVRVYSEDAAAGFLPASGVIRRLELPQGPGIRNDVGIQLGDVIGLSFDPLLAKLIVWGADRAEAVARLRDALRRYCLLGLTTNLPFLLHLAEEPDFAAGRVSTRFLPDHPWLASAGAEEQAKADLAEAARVWLALRASPDPFRHGWRTVENAALTPDGGLLLAGRRYYLAESERGIEAWCDGRRGLFEPERAPSVENLGKRPVGGGSQASLTAPMPGVVVKLLVEEGQRVEAHQTLLLLEAMKMEHGVQAPAAGIVRRLHAKLGGLAAAGEVLAELTPDDAAEASSA